MPDPAPKPRYATDDPARQRSREESDLLMADPPAALQAWADRQGVRLNDRPAGVWGNIEGRLRQLDLLAVARIWRHEQIRELVNAGVTARKLTAKEICMRVIVERMLASKDSIVNVVHQGDESELDCLPKHIRWAFLHPGLAVAAAGEKAVDPVMQAVAVNYEREHKAPNAAALTLYQHCRTDGRARDNLFKEVKVMLMESQKSAAAEAKAVKADGGSSAGDPGPPEKSAEEQALMDLDEELVKEGEED